MKSFKSILAIAALAMAIPFAVTAEEGEKKAKKERTSRGTLVCAKCSLGKTKSCQAALTNTRKNKQGEEVERVILLTNNDVAKAFHKNICSGDKVPVKVTGVRTGKRKDGTLALTASKIEKAKAKKKKKNKA